MIRIENSSKQEIKTIIEAQKVFFRRGETLDLDFRLQAEV